MSQSHSTIQSMLPRCGSEVRRQHFDSVVQVNLLRAGVTEGEAATGAIDYRPLFDVFLLYTNN